MVNTLEVKGKIESLNNEIQDIIKNQEEILILKITITEI